MFYIFYVTCGVPRKKYTTSKLKCCIYPVCYFIFYEFSIELFIFWFARFLFFYLPRFVILNTQNILSRLLQHVQKLPFLILGTWKIIPYFIHYFATRDHACGKVIVTSTSYYYLTINHPNHLLRPSIVKYM